MTFRPISPRAPLVALLLFVLVLLAPSASRAQALPSPSPSSPPGSPALSAEARAAELKQRGDAAMDARRYADALDAYTEAYAASPNPSVLYNRARVSQAMGRYPDALADLEAFARTAPPEIRARVPKLDALTADVRGRVAELALTCNVQGARVVVRSVIVGATPLPGPLGLNAGRAVVEVSADGYAPARREVDLPGGGSLALKIALVPLPRAAAAPAGPATTPRDERSVFSRWWFWTAVGVAAGTAAAVTVAATQPRAPDHGTIGTGQIATPLVLFP